MKYFAIKSDQHIIEPQSTLAGIDTTTRAQKLIWELSQEPMSIDFILDLGDVCDTTANPNRLLAIADTETYKSAKTLFAPLKSKTLYIPGNHDDPAALFNILGDNWDDRSHGCFTYKWNAVDIIGIDARTGPEAGGRMRPETLDKLDEVLSKSSRAMIATHYPFETLDAPWLVSEGGISNVQDLRIILKKHRSRIAALFHGHFHSWWSGVCDGIPFFSCGPSSFTFDLPPGATSWRISPEKPCGYLIVGMDGNGEVLIRSRFVS